MATPPLSCVARASRFASRPAVIDAAGPHPYGELLDVSARVAGALLGDRTDLDGERIAVHMPPGFGQVALTWGIWRAGGIAVPLALSHPTPELAHVLTDADVERAIVIPGLGAALPEGTPVIDATALSRFTGNRPASDLPPVDSERPALLVYTSGTTSRPKGVVITHRMIDAQVAALTEAWEWSAHDRILNVLPLHHVHGLINVVACALWSGATCEMPERFDPARTWERLASGALSLFMAVPTVYRRLIAFWESRPSAERATLASGARTLRLMVSGSAALPVEVLRRWRQITGHTLLERYGMTEIGMALSNPLHGERRPGTVGAPLPGVEVRLVDESGRPVSAGTPGELEVRGPGVFDRYWRRPEATAAAFRNGWFRTGDVATETGGVYTLLGRTSVDIIKTGGFKVSALEIENVLRSHPDVPECAVVGLPDDEWGERIGVVVETTGPGPTLDALQDWSRDRLAPYKLPRSLIVTTTLPRNALGKIRKPDVRRLFEEEEPQ